jgi:proteic killer suppression protein
MIASFQHKGLKLFYDKGNASKLQPQHVAKIRLILSRLDAAVSPTDLNVPGYGLHQLTGDLAGFWAVSRPEIACHLPCRFLFLLFPEVPFWPSTSVHVAQ